MYDQKQNNEQLLRDINNLNQEDLMDIYSMYGTSKRNGSKFSGQVFSNAGLISQTAVSNNEVLRWNHFTSPAIVEAPRKESPVMSLDAKHLYQNAIFPTTYKLDGINIDELNDIDLYFGSLSDPLTRVSKEITKNLDKVNMYHPQWNFPFNVLRRQLGMISIELDVGNEYYLKLGNQFKLMTLKRIDGDINTSDFSCYFLASDLKTSAKVKRPMEVSYVKIITQKIGEENEL